MDIYTQKSKWKWYLAIAGILILLLTMSFTTYLSRQLAKEEEKKAELLVFAMQKVSAGGGDSNMLFEEVVANNFSIPLIVYDEKTNEIKDIREFETGQLLDSLSTGEQEKIGLWLQTMQQVSVGSDDSFFELIVKIMSGNTTIPVILYDPELDSIISANNFGEERDFDQDFLRKELDKMKTGSGKVIEAGPQQLYYKQSTTLTLLQYFPIFQMLLIGAFIAFGYFTFSSARRGEQNRVWAGMAKETAHQLGTPISAMLGWIEHLKLIREDDEEIHEVADELRNDVARLELVADRFSKIGSAPELKEINLYDELEDCRAYMQRRASRRVKFNFPEPTTSAPVMANINSHLFVWVVENLLRNALDAMGGKGEIGANVYEEDKYVCVDIWDTGKGIPQSKWKTVFQPGFSTKKRGWGLGLSLAKRIIEEYHAGKIFVKDSKEGEGTTFSIWLPK